MSIHRCPDCVNVRDRTTCRTCMGSAYVHRNSHGRITHPADPADFSEQERKRPLKPRPLHYGKPSKFR